MTATPACTLMGPLMEGPDSEALEQGIHTGVTLGSLNTRACFWTKGPGTPVMFLNHQCYPE